MNMFSQVKMDNAKQSFLHVSQSVPTESDMEVTMKKPVGTQVHVSQAVPRSRYVQIRISQFSAHLACMFDD
jgi:hypothetical protein